MNNNRQVSDNNLQHLKIIQNILLLIAASQELIASIFLMNNLDSTSA